MAFISHIPGTLPVLTPPPHPQRKGLGVVGLHEGRTLLLAMNRCAHIHAVAACDLSEEKLAASRAELPDLFYTRQYRDMLARRDVDIVAIYTPDHLHGEHIALAFEAGKDVICTKPLVNSMADARRILETGRRTGRRLFVGQSTRFFEPFRRQRAAFERGELGVVELADAHYTHRMDWYYRKSDWVARSTDWVYLGLSHPLDLLRWYLGPIRSAQAVGGVSSLGREHGLKGRDVYAVNVVAESGAIGRAMGHYGVHELPTARNCIELMLYGSAGSSLAQYHDMKFIRTAPDGSEVTEDFLYAGRHYYFNSEVHGMHYGEFANYADAFARSLLEGTPCAPGLEEGIETFCVMEAVRRSADSGEAVALDPLRVEAGLR